MEVEQVRGKKVFALDKAKGFVSHQTARKKVKQNTTKCTQFCMAFVHSFQIRNHEK